MVSAPPLEPVKYARANVAVWLACQLYGRGRRWRLRWPRRRRLWWLWRQHGATHSTHSIRVRIGHSPIGIYGTPVGSFWLDAGELDHLGPFLGLIGDELAEIGRRTGEHGATKLGKPRLDLGIVECGVGLPVELVDDGRGRSLGRAEAPPVAVLVARQVIGDGRHIWQRLR